MTPPIPTTQDRVRLASKRRQTTRLIVNAVPLRSVASAVIDDASISYPLVALDVTDTSTDWLTEALAGRRFGIGTAPGLTDIADGVLRFDATSNAVTLDPRYAGDGGFARDIKHLIETGHYLTVYDDYPPYGIQSSIRGKTFYKMWDVAFSAAQRNPTPIIRLGTHPRYDVDPDTGTAEVTLAADVFHFPGRSYVSHQWTVSDGSIVSQDASHITATLPAGCHDIRLRVTDNKGRSSTAYRKVFVNGPDYPPLAGTTDTVQGRFHLTSADCIQDRSGYTITLTFEGQFETGDFYPGQMFVLHELATWNEGETLDNPDAVAHTFVGYAGDAAPVVTPDTREVTLTIYAPVTLAEKIVVPRQTMIEKSAPGNWSQITPVLSNPVGYFWYLVALHAPYLLNGHDFDFDTDLLTLRRQAAQFANGDALGQHLKQLAEWLNGVGVIGSRTDGTTRMLRHPNYMDNDERNMLPTQWAWEPGHIRQRLEHRYQWWPRVGRSYASAFASNGGAQVIAHRAVAPGFLNSQAPGETSLTDTIVPYAGALDRVLALSGYHHAAQNARTQPEATLAYGNLDVAQPVDVDRWHVFSIPATYDPMGGGWVQQRRLCTGVRRVWTPEGKEVTHEWEVETFGFPGLEVPYNTGAGSLWVNRYVPSHFQPYAPRMPELGYLPAVMTAWNTARRLGRSFNFATPNTHFSRMQPDTDEGTLYATLDPHSAYFSDPADPLEMAIVSYNAPSLTLWRVTDLLADTLEYTELDDWTPGTDFVHQAMLAIDPLTSGFWVLVWRDRAGTHIFRSTDSGANWDTGVVLGHADPVNVGETAVVPVGLAVYDERIVVTAHEGDTDTDGDFIYFVYTAVGTGSFTQIANPSGYRVSPAAIALTSATNAIVGIYRKEAPEPQDPLEAITFTPNDGYEHYTVSGTGQSSGVNEFSGNYEAFSSHNTQGVGGTGTGPGGVSVSVDVDLDAYYTFNGVTLDIDHVASGSVTGRQATITVTLMDADDSVLSTYTRTIDDEFPDGEYTITAAEMDTNPTEWVWQVRVSVGLTWAAAGLETITAFIDNVDIDAALVDFGTDRALYSLNPSTGAYTRRQSYQLLPFHQHGIAADGNGVTCIARDEHGGQPYLLLSSNGGQSWTKSRRVEGFVGAKRKSAVNINGTLRDIVLMFGYNRLHISVNGGVSSYDASGDWIAGVGPLAIMDGVAGIL